MISFNEQQQDVRTAATMRDTSAHTTDTSASSRQVISNDSTHQRRQIIRQVIQPDLSDTTSVCMRNNIADVTFYDYNSFIFRMGYGTTRQFPFVFLDKSRQLKTEKQEYLIRHLRDGSPVPPNPLHADWIIIILMVSAFLFTVVKSASKNMTAYFDRVFVFRKKRESVTHDVTGIFHWQSTFLNLCSFLIIGIFGYSAAAWFGVISEGSAGILQWLFVVLVIIAAVTIRHAVCLLTGSLSGEEELFREYLVGIYHTYRTAAAFLLVCLVLMTYTSFLPAGPLVISGVIVIGILYVIRVIRLLLIFLNRGVSILYLILYLCALEILPVLVIIKYITGLV